MRILLLGFAASLALVRCYARHTPPEDRRFRCRRPDDLSARYTHSDARSAYLVGGVLGRFTSAVNWFLNQHMRLSVIYGTGTLYRGTGKAQFEI